MTITPQGQLYLCKTKLENDYKNQLTFSNATEQLNYFNSVIQHIFSDYTYIKKDNTVKVGKNIDEIIDCNYLFYKNKGFTDKYYFCFITNMEYVSENCTLISFETDCYQTWLFQIEYKQSFIEREHVNNDAIGLHTIPENLETGEYIINELGRIDEDDELTDTLICMGVSWTPDNIPNYTDDRKYGGVYSGLSYFVFSDASSCSKMCKAYDDLAKADAIYTLFLVPRGLIGTLQWYSFNLGNQEGIVASFPTSTNFSTTIIGNKQITSPTSLNGYTPKNNKLYCWPFNYLYLSNNNGADVTFNYEDFINNTPIFNVDGVISTGCSIRLHPSNYKKINTAQNYPKMLSNFGLPVGKYPTCSWNSDTYTNWLTEQAINLPLQIGGLGLSLVSSVATGGATSGAVVSSAMQIGDLLSSVYQHSLVPEQAKGNTNTGDVVTGMRLNSVNYYKMSIKEEYARSIDEYFSMFGYKINRVKTPNITGRRYYNYVKTVDCNFDGDIPQTDLQIIKTMFNNGVTLWHDPSKIYDYSVDNDII